MKALIILNIFIFSILLFSCEKEIELKQDDIKSRIVVNSIFSANDTVIVHLSESRNILYNNGGTLPNIEDATVKLYNDDIEFGTLIHQSEGFYTLNSPFPVEGQTYELKVTHSKFDNVTTKSICPKSITISSVDTTRQGEIMKYNFSIQDDGLQENYYSIQFITTLVYKNEITPGNFKNDTVTVNNTICTRDINAELEQDPNGLSCDQEILYTDKNFNGQSYTFNIEQSILPEAIKSTIIVRNISADLFKYKKTLQLYKANQDNPFGEPVQVYSNIKDGLGIFSGYSISKKIILF